MKKRSKKYVEALSKLEKGKVYTKEEAAKLVKETSVTSFDGSVEVAVRLNDKIANENWFEFDTIIASPEMMPLLGKLGKVLGPKGLMPNPKTGTVTVDVAKAVKEVKAGRAEYRTDSFGNVHGIIGRVSFSAEDLIENLDAFMAQLLKVKPSTVKGEYVKNITICSTMGPGIKVENNFDK